jgi:hypothetical protein
MPLNFIITVGIFHFINRRAWIKCSDLGQECRTKGLEGRWERERQRGKR